MVDFKVLGQNHNRVDALDKVTGQATYASDVYLPGMLMCKLLPSTRSHARILSIDTSRAEQLPGVRAIITGKDFPDLFFGSGAVKDRRIMARDEVFYIGEPVAAVAADDETTAQEALELIQVEYQDQERVVDPLQAIKSGATAVHPDMAGFEGYGFAMGGNNCTLLDADRGDVDQAFDEADHIIEETYHSQAINQGFLEPMACVANLEANGRLTVWASTQGPYQVRAQLASVLDMPISRIKVIAMELGGGFGAKLRLAFEAYPAFLAMKTGRPVKLINTREEVFTLNGPRLATSIYLKTAVNNDGNITAREARSIFDVGAYLGAGPNAGVGHALGPYNIPNFRLRSYGIYTNKIYVGSYRASGVADMTFAIESHMDSIAHKLGLDPLEFRIKNAIKEGDVGVSGAKLPRNGLMETIMAVKERLDLPRKLEEGRGVGIALCEWRSGSGPSTASISVNEDGTISLLTGSVDISGSDTSLAQIAAESLGLRMEDVIVAKRDTDMAPFTGPSGGSRIVYSQGKAVQMAAEDARQKLFALAAERFGVPADALACDGGRVYVQDNPPQSLTLGQLGRLSLTSRNGPIIGLASLSSMPYAPVFNTQGAEVLVDKATGQVKVTRFVQAQDVGVAINPMSVEGQLSGGVVQGIGRALSEELLIDDDTGRVRNPSLSTYLMPLALDMPEVENILINVPSEDGPFGARAVAEPPGFGPPAAIANAIFDAVGVRIKELPLSAERVLAALQGQDDGEVVIDVEALREAEAQQA
ncbi:MAG: xanthine dehydrogenase family protein molybdopterin-binding subunit [Chloroflexi bacterium]|nr:xanthine dehydrogenase family protein molybdopterin-binding subunit [Chloroflexota bacterium]MCI0793250.1 xanthine dehydrogenase family protein molybdopterin-binding subunit [Chloroflexota bacterium]MCI0798155.1 xanthine dehydrogenase family protein molybdopterin-binding subunit [Chloroflexota bacterium]MCI0858110.1 xanthine dehydrogenase family protein molybdopterin-binding subunit [Chloroflexota bacterium]MCI0868039.1 xanthine dehydrogenase family protein molybdopterin-binding subunit [Chl